MMHLSSLLLSLGLTLPCAQAATPEEAREEARGAPPVRLVVMVSVDQLIPEQLERLEPWLDGGLGRFLRDGQVWLRARHDHARTATGPGHATLSTGCRPNRHGIIGNQWTGTDRTMVYCVGDPEAALVTEEGPRPELRERRSPANLQVPGLADHLRAARPQSRSVGISFKDRAATLGTGQEADLALWWNRQLGFVTSTHYADSLPGWVLEWNLNWRERTEPLTWTGELPEGAAAAGTAPDERAGEATWMGAFPRTSPAVSPSLTARQLQNRGGWVYVSPFADRFVLELAHEAVRFMELGADAEPDYLFLGLSGTDAIGHSFGPYSREVTSNVLSTDEALGEFFAYLDEEVGEDRWVAALSSDHGVLPLPEKLQDEGTDARRVDPRQITALMKRLRQEIAAEVGFDAWVMNSDYEVRIREDVALDADFPPADVRRLIADELLAQAPWIRRAYTREEIEGDGDVHLDPEDALLALVRKSYHPERSADVITVLQPWTIPNLQGTTHGSPYDYDRIVPLAFLGPGFEAQRRYDDARTIDLLPTLFAHLGLPLAAEVDGRPLDR